MRHRNTLKKLGRNATQRDRLITNLIVSLIEHKRLRITLGKAKALRPIAEKIITLGRKHAKANEGRPDTRDTPRALALRQLAISRVRNNRDAIKHLIDVIVPVVINREGGYLRITKLGQRRTDAAPMAYIEFVDRDKLVPANTPEDAAAVPNDDGVIEAEVVQAEGADAEEAPKAKKAATKKAATKKAATKKAATKKAKSED